MQLQLQDFATLVRTQAAAATASCRELVDVTVGSVLRAILEANASVALWLQWLIVQVLATTRASTSAGADLDSWVADFAMARLPASPASGQVIFSRVSAGLATVIPVGALVRTGTGPTDQLFVVSADPSNSAWTGNGYQLSASGVGVSAPIVAQHSGAAGNVRAGAINQLSSAIPGIDLVANDAPLYGGLDAESDQALRLRFTGFLDSRTRATAQAIGFAISSVRQGLSFTVAERVDAAGAIRPGHFTITVDDGTGAPSAALMAEIATAVEQVRPVGGTYGIRAPLVVPANVSLRVSGTASALVATRGAVVAYVAALPIGAPLVISKIYQVAHDADRQVTRVSDVAINGSATDLIPPMFGLIRPSTILVTS